jgi:methyl-accepting chemotaxis protein
VRLTNWKLATRLGMGFGLLMVFLIILAAVTITRINASNQAIGFILEDRYVKVVLTKAIETEINVQARDLRNAIILGAGEKAQIAAIIDRIAESVQRTDGFMTKLKSMINTPKGEALFESLSQARAKYGVTRTATMALLREGKTTEAGAYLLKEGAGRCAIGSLDRRCAHHRRADCCDDRRRADNPLDHRACQSRAHPRTGSGQRRPASTNRRNQYR